MGNKHTLSDLYQMQAMPLSAKIRMTKYRIDQFVDKYGEDGVYLSFSAGKDSTVLGHIIRKVCGYKNIPFVFADVPTQYPELKQFAMTFDNIVILKPKISFSEVCKKYGFPLISKEVSESVYGAKKYLTEIIGQIEFDRQTDRQTDRQQPHYKYFYEKITGTGKYSKFSDAPSNTGLILEEHLKAIRGGTIKSIIESEKLANLLNSRMKSKAGGSNRRLAIMIGMLTTDKENPIKENPTREEKSSFSQEKYKFMLESPFDISNKCCTVMKKKPLHEYHRKTGRNPITATMASESKLRTQKWLQNGCNGFNLKIPTSNPMSFWTEQDVLLYIKINNLPICSVYGDVVIDYDAEGSANGQMDLSELSADYGLFDTGNRPLKTTGCSRTGCVLCGFGCHLEKPGEGRFERLKETHPGMYKLLDVIENNGVTYREAIDWINEHGNMNIRY
nr:MAG TPA: phosphoadenosine-phosphosulfate reductase [Caudoviricetes sp.]